ncbi:MAG: hypothetical protein Q4G22_09470 [Paracoccus sp. (in: a-proteobacteria)]|nr:hypothetical protein [Paracoccus sp. (in: a-proteobacteria)]MDO5632056.1 hypothetical protein [Paracoccus sp. (in: a-proteobacteria)]
MLFGKGRLLPPYALPLLVGADGKDMHFARLIFGVQAQANKARDPIGPHRQPDLIAVAGQKRGNIPGKTLFQTLWIKGILGKALRLGRGVRQDGAPC